MSYLKSVSLVSMTVLSLAAFASDASAQHRGGGGGGGHAGGHVGTAAPRGGAVAGPRGGVVAGPRGAVVAGSHGAVAFPRYYGGGYYGHAHYVYPRVVGVYPYHPYYYPYRPGITVGFYAGIGVGFGYPYSYGYPYPYYYGYPYPAPAYGYTQYGNGANQPYGANQYGYGPAPAPQNYVSTQQGVAYGGVRIEGAPGDAQVFVDGNYMGVVEDFDGPSRHMNLPAGSHQIEIRPTGRQAVAFDVNVQAGQTISVHADIR